MGLPGQSQPQPRAPGACRCRADCNRHTCLEQCEEFGPPGERMPRHTPCCHCLKCATRETLWRQGLMLFPPEHAALKPVLARWSVAFARSLKVHLREDGDVATGEKAIFALGGGTVHACLTHAHNSAKRPTLQNACAALPQSCSTFLSHTSWRWCPAPPTGRWLRCRRCRRPSRRRRWSPSPPAAWTSTWRFLR